MKLKCVAGIAILFSITLRLCGQKQDQVGKVWLHLYPTTSLAGDLSFGAEHCFSDRFSHELSFAFKVLPHSWYRYDEGYRVNYQVKYDLVHTRNFRFSGGISCDHLNIWFDDELIEYHYMNDLNHSEGIYGITRESERVSVFGAGLVLSPVFSLGKRFVLGGDLFMNYSLFIKNKMVHEVLYFNEDLRQMNPGSVPVSYDYSRYTVIPFIRAKIGYVIG